MFYTLKIMTYFRLMVIILVSEFSAGENLTI